MSASLTEKKYNRNVITCQSWVKTIKRNLVELYTGMEEASKLLLKVFSILSTNQ